MEINKGLPDDLIYILSNLREKHLKEDERTTIIISGKERKGKSNLGLWCKHYYNDDQDIHLIGRDLNGFIKAVFYAKRGACVIDDEAVKGLKSSDRLDKKTKDLISALQVCGARNFLTIIVIPNIFELHKDIRERQADYFFYVYGKGKASFFDTEDKIKEILTTCKKMSDIPYKKGYCFTFSRYDGPLKEAYAELKDNNVNDTLTDLYNKYIIKEKLSLRKASSYLGIDKGTFSKLIEEYKIPHEKGLTGRLYFDLEVLREFKKKYQAGAVENGQSNKLANATAQ